MNHAVGAGQIQRYELRYLNGFYDDYFLLGNTFITPDFQIKKEMENVILKTQKVDFLSSGREYVSATDFFEEVQKIFSRRVSILSFLTYSALFL